MTAARSSLVTISSYTIIYVTVTLMYVAYRWQRKVSVLLIESDMSGIARKKNHCSKAEENTVKFHGATCIEQSTSSFKT
jgi:hypothetical protein